MLVIKGLSASLKGKPIIKSVDLKINSGEIHLIMGPNGAGKSTLLTALMGLENVKVGGKATLDGKDLLQLETYERALTGLFIGFQQPIEVPGVHFVEFLRTAYNAQHPEDKYDPWSFMEIFDAIALKVGLSSDFNERNLNEGFSGGEKKRAELLQMMILRPKYAFLDEIDSGLDIVSLQQIFSLIRETAEKNSTGIAVITHNPNILQYVKPDFVHLLKDGEITESGGAKLVNKILVKGY